MKIEVKSDEQIEIIEVSPTDKLIFQVDGSLGEYRNIGKIAEKLKEMWSNEQIIVLPDFIKVSILKIKE